MKTAISITHLSVTLDRKVEALRDISAALPAGKTIGIIGPSGAGKTTLLKSIVGRLKTKEGAITVFGQNAGSPTLRHSVTYMTQELSVYEDLTAWQNLRYFAVMAGQSIKGAKATATHILETVKLTDKANSLVSNLSGGQKQRVSLGVALIGSPKVMVLDEPTVGLDPVLRDSLWQLFRQLAAQGITLIISSHSMDEAHRCDDLLLLRRGKIVAHSSPRQLLARTQTKTIEESFLKLVGGKDESA